MCHCLEFGVSGNNSGIFSYGCGHNKCISVGDRIFSLDFCGCENQVVGAGVYLNGKELHLLQDIFGKGGVLDPGTPIVDFPKVDNVQQNLLLTLLSPVEEIFYDLCPFLVLNPCQHGEGVQQ